MDAPDFIEVDDRALDAASCQALIERFEASGQAVRGATGGGVDVKLKDKLGHPARRPRQLGRRAQATQRGGPGRAAALWAPLSAPAAGAAATAQARRRRGEPVLIDAEALQAMDDSVLGQLVNKVLRPGTINLQKYHADQGGYPYWHSEQYPRLDGAEALHRVVLWSIYLNEGFDEGVTEFLYQQRRIRPRTGALLIAPAAFTHTHRGNRPKGGDKYIATSWSLFQRAESLYGAPRA